MKPQTSIMNRFIASCATAALSLCVFIGNAFAATPAGTTISNQVTASYSIDNVPQPDLISNVAAFTVNELIDVQIAWQDASAVSVSVSEPNRALRFLLTNTGNGEESFALMRQNVVPNDIYDPLNGSVGSMYIENGLSPGFQATGPYADTLYIAGTNDPRLAPNASATVYVISDTPSGLNYGNTGNVALTATATTKGAAGAAPGTNLAGLGINGINAVVGLTSAQAQAVGTYIVSGLIVKVIKSASCTPAPSDCSKATSGTIVNYQIQVVLSGTGTADHLVITDPLPASTTYQPNSLAVDSTSKTDAIDADNAQFLNNQITVDLSSPAAPKTLNISFKASIY